MTDDRKLSLGAFLTKLKPYGLPALRTIFSLLIAAVLTQFSFDYIEAVFYDARIRLRPAPPTSGLIELVAVDGPTIEKLGRTPNATDHALLLQKLKAAGARIVIYLIQPDEIVGSYDELAQIAELAKSFPQFYVAIPDVAPKADRDFFKLKPPFEELVAASAVRTWDNTLYAKDDVTRRLFISYQGQPSLHQLVAQEFNPEVGDESNIRGLFSYLDAQQVYIDFRPTHTYPMHSFQALSLGEESLHAMKDKIVMVGRDIQLTPKDYIRTPYDRDLIAMTVLEMHANALDTLIKNSAPVQAPAWLNLFFTGIISILTVYAVLQMKPSLGLFAIAVAMFVFATFCQILFWWQGVWITMAHPFLAIFICYYFFIPYRLIMENRRSWEYYQKNRLLTQVEELKTNFMSMMSHDLKTPIARIQGMSDVTLKDPHPLSERQREAVSTIRKSADELLEFISSILNLGRIESKELKLHFQSRDVNQLLEEIARKFEYMAKAKGIRIALELEPLFSVKLDVDLMRQVFSNLLENAIKYSAEGTKILVTTEERDGHLIVQVADQGLGIPEDEMPNIFMKFYRSKQAKSSTIKGSGLGLYLAKYFVELHHGKISVDSSYGQGSTFTVELPMRTAEA